MRRFFDSLRSLRMTPIGEIAPNSNKNPSLGYTNPEEGIFMKKNEEKKPIPWEVADPKPPVIQSGHMENRRH